MASLQAFIQSRVALDSRTLACFRVLLALIVVIEWCSHALPESVAAVSHQALSIVTTWNLLGTIFLYVSALTFAVGYKSRISALLLWLTFSVLHAGFGQGIDAIICGLLLFSVFVPLGRTASFDDAMDRGSCEDGRLRGESTAIRSIATAGLSLFALFAAVAVACHSQYFDARFALGQSNFGLMAMVTAVVMIVVVCLPRRFALARFWIVAGVVAGLLLVTIGQSLSGSSLMPGFLLAVLALLFLNGEGWSWLGVRAINKRRHELRIYYDEPCGFCRKICFIFASFMLLGKCQIATAQSDEQAHTLLRENDSWVVFDHKGNYALCWAALLVLMRMSPLWRPIGWLLTIIGMGKWGQPIYRFIGSIRGSLSYLTARVLPYTPFRADLNLIEKLLLVVWFVVIVLYYTGLLGVLPDAFPQDLTAFGLFQRRL